MCLTNKGLKDKLDAKETKTNSTNKEKKKYKVIVRKRKNKIRQHWDTHRLQLLHRSN